MWNINVLHNHKSVFTRKSFASSQPFVFEAANNSMAGEQERQEEGANVEHWSLFHASLQLSLCSQTIVTLDLWSICKLSSWLDGKGANMKDTQLTRTWQEETCRPSWVCTTTSSESSSGRPSWLGNRRMLALLCISSQIPLLLFISFFLFIFFHHRLFSGLGSGSEPCWPGNDFQPPANINPFSASIFFLNHGEVQVSLLCITVYCLCLHSEPSGSFWTRAKCLCSKSSSNLAQGQYVHPINQGWWWEGRGAYICATGCISAEQGQAPIHISSKTQYQGHLSGPLLWH